MLLPVFSKVTVLSSVLSTRMYLYSNGIIRRVYSKAYCGTEHVVELYRSPMPK